MTVSSLRLDYLDLAIYKVAFSCLEHALCHFTMLEELGDLVAREVEADALPCAAFISRFHIASLLAILHASLAQFILLFLFGWWIYADDSVFFVCRIL